MKEIKKELNFPEGSVETFVTIFTEDDKKIIKFIYNGWLDLCKNLKKLGARGVNIPEVLSETVICMYKSWYRINNTKIGKIASSFDAYDPKASVYNNRIQIKACSVLNDLTSFGPDSVWDRIYFADFYNDGNFDGKVVLYELNTDDIKEFAVNKNQSFQDQQEEKRRPRFSIKKELISKGKYITKEEFNLFDIEILEID